jgi:hypothetical protein
MAMRRISIGIALLLIVLSGLAQAQTSDRAGSVGALFLKLGLSPRAAAMGNTYMGISDDITGVFLNPVSIVRLTGYEFFVSELEYLGEPSPARSPFRCLRISGAEPPSATSDFSRAT